MSVVVWVRYPCNLPTEMTRLSSCIAILVAYRELPFIQIDCLMGLDWVDGRRYHTRPPRSVTHALSSRVAVLAFSGKIICVTCPRWVGVGVED